MKVAMSRPVLAVAAALVIAVSFAAGYSLRSPGPVDLSIYTASGYVGADQASFQVGDTTFGFESSVPWTDQAGSEHPDGWPACLPKLQTVSGVRFGGAVVWHGDSGEARVLWVDCRA
jgi:hypothetical protein